MGSVESAITPTSVITMLITPAKIGRSMKKCGKFMAMAPTDKPLSLCLVRLRDAGRRACSRRLRNRLNSHTGLQQLQTRRDNFLAILQTVLHDSFSFENTSGFKITAFDCVIRFHDERVFQSLLRTDHSVVDKSGSIRRRAGNAHASKKSWRDECRIPIF